MASIGVYIGDCQSHMLDESNPRKRRRGDYSVPVRLNPLTIISTRSLGEFRPIFKATEVSSKSPSELIILPQISRKMSIRPHKWTSIFFANILTITSILTLICFETSNCDTESLNRAYIDVPYYTLPANTRPNLDKLENFGSGSSTLSNEVAASTSHKERLLSSLSESIERQHFAMKPVRALVGYKRPSKFDSGDEYTKEVEPLTGHLNMLNQSNSSSTNSDKQLGKLVKKVDDSMKHILRMHEHAVEPKSSSKTREQHHQSSQPHLLELGARHASSPAISNKFISHMMSYMTPLVYNPGLRSLGGLSELPATIKRLIPIGIEREKSTAESELKASRYSLGQNFIGRSHEPRQLSLSDRLKTWKTSPVSGPVSPPGRPEQAPIGGPGVFSEPLGSTSKFVGSLGNSILKSALVKPNISPKDLVADSSFTSAISTIQEPLTKPTQLSSNSNKQQKQWHPTSASQDLVSPSSGDPQADNGIESKTSRAKRQQDATSGTSFWPRDSANKVAQSYLQDSFRGLLTLSQLPILPASHVSTAPSVLERQGRLKSLKDQRHYGNKTLGSSSSPGFYNMVENSSQAEKALEALVRYAYILAVGGRRKRDPLQALEPAAPGHALILRRLRSPFLRQRNLVNSIIGQRNNETSKSSYARRLRSSLTPALFNKADPRGIVWEMATDPSLAVTVFHLIEKASVALPLGFLLMPMVKMIRHNPLAVLNLDKFLPPRASHRSVDYEELAKRLDIVDKMLSRALRSTHRDSSFLG